ncbi:zinc finger, CCHC-type containing protein [Tanacetum coccineum]
MGPHKGVQASASSDVMYSFTSAQDGDPLQDDVRLCLGDDLKKAQDHSQRQAIYHNKGKGKEVGGPSVNMTEEGKNKHNKKTKTGHFKRDCRSGNKKNANAGGSGKGSKDHFQDQDIRTSEDGSVLYMGDDHFAPVHGIGSVALEFSSRKTITLFNVLYVPKLHKNLVSGPDLVIITMHARLGHVHYKRMLEMYKDDIIPGIDENPEKCTTYDASRFCYVYLLHAKGKALDEFRIYKTEVELQQKDLVKTLRTDRGGEYYDPVFFQSVGIIHETTAPYTPHQNGVAERKYRALKEMVNSMLSYSGLSEGFWGEAMLTAWYLLNRVPNKRNKTTPYELWCKKRPNLSYLRVWGCRAVVRLPDPKRKTLGEKGIGCIFVGYAKHSKAYRFYVIEPNDSVSINSIIESRDAIFNENHFSSMPRPKDIIPNLKESQRDDHSDDVPSETPEPRRGHRARKAKSYGSDFQLYLVEGSRDQVGSQYSYCYSYEEDPRTYNEAMQSRDAAFWKKAIDDEIGSIMENNT